MSPLAFGADTFFTGDGATAFLTRAVPFGDAFFDVALLFVVLGNVLFVDAAFFGAAFRLFEAATVRLFGTPFFATALDVFDEADLFVVLPVTIFFLTVGFAFGPTFFTFGTLPFPLAAFGAAFFALLKGLALAALFSTLAGAVLALALAALVGFAAGFFFLAMCVVRGGG